MVLTENILSPLVKFRFEGIDFIKRELMNLHLPHEAETKKKSWVKLTGYSVIPTKI